MNGNEPPDDLIDVPLRVSLLGEAIVLTGPDGIAIAITARAARESASLLSIAAKRAAQNVGGGLKHVRRVKERDGVAPLLKASQDKT